MATAQMTNFSRDLSRETLTERRRKLRRQRGLKVLRTIWRTLLVSAMAGGLVWSLTLRFWVLSSAAQVQIQGTELIDPQTIQDLLDLHYPLSLLRIEPQKLVTTLESSAPIAQAEVTREVVPPRLIITVQERRPVAQASLAAGVSLTPEENIAPGQEVWGLLDERGFWIPIEQFTKLQSQEDLPPLKVLGIRPDFRQSWQTLYLAIRQSPIKITEVDWRDPNNLILQTELGLVHLGVLSDKIHQQLQALDRFRNLPDHPQFKDMEYLDLHDPANPYLRTTTPLPTPTPTPKPNN